jgi:hypothetical protein
VSGKKIPPLSQIEEEIDKSLTLWNWRWPRSIAVKGIALALRRWAEDVGLEKAARRGALLFEAPTRCFFQDTASRIGPDEQLTAEEFADHAEVMIDEFESRDTGSPDGRCDQHLLPRHGSAHPVDCSGDTPSDEGTGS